jgi:hypothetical protein
VQVKVEQRGFYADRAWRSSAYVSKVLSVMRQANPSCGGWEMNDREINEAIAKSLGWTRADESYPYEGSICKCIVWRDEKGTPLPLGDDAVHNYANSLDACAEFERTIKDEDFVAYSDELCLMAKYSEGAVESWRRVVSATPRQRCEAFLRMKGLWK